MNTRSRSHLYTCCICIPILCMLSSCISIDSVLPRSINPFSTKDHSPEMQIYRGDATTEQQIDTAPEEKHLSKQAGWLEKINPFSKSRRIDDAEKQALPTQSLTEEVTAETVEPKPVENDEIWRKHRFSVEDGIMEVLSPGAWDAIEAKRRQEPGYLSTMFIPKEGDADAPRNKVHVRYRKGDKGVVEKSDDLKRAIKLFCGEKHVRVLVPEAENNTLMLLRLCGNISGGMNEATGLSAYGEVSLMYLIRGDEGIYSISHDWKVPAFDAQSDEDLFLAVPERTLQYHASALKRTRICDNEETCR